MFLPWGDYISFGLVNLDRFGFLAAILVFGYDFRVGLPQISENLRKIIKISVIILLAGAFLWFSFVAIRELFYRFYQPRTRDVAFGKLVPPSFVGSYQTTSAAKWVLSTSFPPYKDEIEIYKSIQNPIFDRQGRDILRYFDLSEKSGKSENDILTFSEGKKVLAISPQEGSFEFRLDYRKDFSELDKRISSDTKTLTDQAKKVLDDLGLLTRDIAEGSSAIVYWSLGEKIQSGVSPAEANGAELFLFRKIGEIDAIGEAPIRILFSGEGRVLSMDFRYYYLDPFGSRYPIISSDRAWKRVQENKGLAEKGLEAISVEIDTAFLAYWDSQPPQTYLQPVWVFRGTATSVGGEQPVEILIPAVIDSYLSVPSP